ncbi:MAG: hypothetical protein OQL06_04135 [Gammaproteobacteria bacterium]|nr:hypothetical protein [Gammaproteobacteria bacterium]
MGDYDFDKIALFAKKRFVEGYNTIELMEQATCDREKEEIALVAMLDLEDETVKDLQLSCIYADKCKITNCRKLLKQLIEDQFISELQ